MSLLVNPSTGKVLVHSGKALVSSSSTVTVYPDIYTDQTITLPYGDEIFILLNSSQEVSHSTDLYTEVLWGNSDEGIIHWGSGVSPEYVTAEYPIHLYEIDLYNEQGYQDCQGSGELEAEYIKEHGRYMGSIWIDGRDWVVSSVDQG